jgi:hypothetical protein
MPITRSPLVRLGAVAMLSMSAVLLVGCGDAKKSTTPAASNPTAVRGTLTSSFVVGVCGAKGTEIPATIDGSGTLTALGVVTVHVDAVAVCGDPGALTSVKNVSGKYTNDRGDTLMFTGGGSAITFANPILSFQSADQFTSGTGRFSRASGTQNVVYSHTYSGSDMTTMSMDVTGGVTITP